ncbi:MAG TPA: hemerythrin [Hyphomonas atlantica]|uniref:Hemerythrin n=1 Tax=Hyphomonas atlantica TaxID=1280948 RepID=A0A356W7V2_9PROT|nr:hemerythrin [Magnetovibrio sp.]MAY65574.1 hemerythrin [Rhodospirillaceae bacterium]HBQ49413.1 hemerythrin [Hyphomonas atlantica]
MIDTIDIIHRDHMNMERVLSVMNRVAEGLGRADGVERSLGLLASIVYYIRLYPERCHHPKEERYLFKVLARRDEGADDLIRELKSQHAEGKRQIARLDLAVKAYDRTREDLTTLRRVVDDYAVFQRRHMDLEESELLPLARKGLADDDWSEVDQAFARDADPLFNENMEAGFRVLFERITCDEAGGARPF